MANAHKLLIASLSDPDAAQRARALTWLSESYSSDPDIMPAVFGGWDTWGFEQAFADFPLLSFLPIAADQVAEVCQRAAKMAENKALTSASSRCAGKILEQVCRLSAAELEPHLEAIESTTKKSKIFFRVDLPAIRNRIACMQLSADELAQQLDTAVNNLASDPNDAKSYHRGLHALEALRRQHPSYMDLAAVLANSPPDAGPQAVSFQVTMQSLVNLPGDGLESNLAQHLCDTRQAVFTNAVEALVRLGSDTAVEALLEQYERAEVANKQWIVRGLQRILNPKLAPCIAQMRAQTNDPHLFTMLLTAEARQLDTNSVVDLTRDIQRLGNYNETVSASLLSYLHIYADQECMEELREALTHYLGVASDNLKQQLHLARKEKQRALDRVRGRARDEMLQRYRKKQ